MMAKKTTTITNDHGVELLQDPTAATDLDGVADLDVARAADLDVARAAGRI